MVVVVEIEWVVGAVFRKRGLVVVGMETFRVGQVEPFLEVPVILE